MEYKKKKVKVIKYQDHPELENKIMEFTIMNSEKIKPRMKGVKQNKKPKQPRMTINQLATIVENQGTKLDQLASIVEKQGTKLDQLALIVTNLALEMRAGFAAVNQRMDKIDDRIDKEVGGIKEVLKRNNIS
jgi:outer membrane murein-binding lipoprotein Lpp